MSQPRKKKGKRKKKSRWAPPVSRPSPSSVLLRATRTHASSPPASILGTRAGHPRAPCPTVPPLTPLSAPGRPRSPANPNPSLPLLYRRRPQAVPPPRFSCSGELWLNPSLGELLLALLLRFRRSPGLICLPAGPPPRRFAAPPPLSVAPPLRRSSSPTSPPVRLAYSSSSPCAPPLVRSGPASSRRLTPPSASARGPRRGRAHPGSRPPGLP